MFRRSIPVFVFLLCPLWATAQEAAPDPAGKSKPRPSAEAIDRTINRDRPSPTPIPPSGSTSRDFDKHRRADAAGDPLWPEGFKLIVERGQLHHSEGRWFLEFQSQENSGRPLRIELLPNTKLWKMERFLAASRKTVQFGVRGDVTEYDGINYLLVRNATVLRAPNTMVPASKPTTSRPVGKSMSTVGAILDQLGSDAPPPRRLSLTSQPTSAPSDDSRRPSAPSVAFQDVSDLVPEDTRETDRVGRLVKEGGWMTYAFESRSEDPAEPPMRLLPNLALQAMEGFSAGDLRDDVFVVSGDVTAYAGHNFLLVRRWRLQPREGNVR